MKNRDILLDVIGDTDDSLIPDVNARVKGRRRWPLRAAAAVVAAALIAGIVFLPRLISGGRTPSVSDDSHLLAAAVYPACVKYPENRGILNYASYQAEYDKWTAERAEKIKKGRECQDVCNDFFLSTAPVFLNSAGDGNIVFSPLSLYMALSMTAEMTGGSTRGELLGVLGEEDIESMRSSARNVWESCYQDDGMAKCVLANSIWLNDSADYDRETLETVASIYYASSYCGDPGAPEYVQSLRGWLNEQTDGELGQYVSKVDMDPMMMIALASTVNYSGKWEHRYFPADKTEEGVFHSPSGDVSCDFMNNEGHYQYLWGEKFSAMSFALENNGEMRLILPDEGIDLSELLTDDEAMSFMTGSIYDWANTEYTTVTLSVPKFDVSSSMDLREGLNTLGVGEIFKSGSADFTPLMGSAYDIAVGKVEQDARVTIDEEGCRASALTVIMGYGAAQPQGRAEFILDRPFIFEIVSESGLPLFIGKVNDPAVSSQ